MTTRTVDALPDEPRLSKAVAAGMTRPKPRSPSSRRRDDQGDVDLADALVAGVALVAGFGAAFADAHPIEWGPGDALLSAAFAGGVTVAASKSRRWTWLVLAGFAGITAREPATIALAALAVGLAFVAAALADRRGRLLGAVIGAAAIQVLLRQPSFRIEGVTALAAGIAVVPVFVSGYRMCRRRTQRHLRRAGFVTAGLVAVAVAGFGYTALETRSQLQNAVADGRAGLASVRAGDQATAERQLDSARRGFAEANASFAGFTTRPARVLPIVGVHVRAARAMAAAGEDLMNAASIAAGSARYEDLKTNSGQVNLALLKSMNVPVAEASQSLERADSQLEAAKSSWLLAPLGGPLSDFQTEVQDARPQAELASEAVKTMPGLLGAAGPRRYLLAFGTPSESRYLGGFIGSYGEMTAVDGKLSLTRAGSIHELSNQPGYEKRTLSGLSSYLDRYGRFQPAHYLQNDSASPDFPTVAEALRQLYPQAGGLPIDGVIYMDPYGLAALLKLTGPITVAGLDQPLTDQNAAEFLLKEQYIKYPEANDVRSDLLSRVTKQTFEALTSRQLPGPRAIADALGPMVTQRRVMMTVFDAKGRGLLDRVGALGSFAPTRPGADFFSFRTSNGGANKIDAYLRRAYDYQVIYTPDTGTTDVKVTVTLSNDAPASGLPDYVIGNSPSVLGQPSQPKGTNLLDYSLYSDAALIEVSQDGQPIGLQHQVELGHQVYSNRVVLGPGATSTLVFHLRGTVAAGTYALDVVPQPGVGRDSMSMAVTQGDGRAYPTLATTGWPENGAAGAAPGPNRIGLEGPRRFEIRYFLG